MKSAVVTRLDTAITYPYRFRLPEKSWRKAAYIPTRSNVLHNLSATDFFLSRVAHALQTRDAVAAPGILELINASEPTRTYGSELLVHYTRGPWHAIGTYTYLQASESDPEGAGRREVPLTPRHAAELAAILEDEARGRIGVEISYTGSQSLEDDPYRRTGAAYVEIGVLGEVRIGDAHLFVNAENLTDVRQTHYDPLLLPAQVPDGRWTTDVWAPLEGRTFNVGVRFEF